MPIQTVDGDLLTATEKYICHQCNCVSVRAAHLAGSVFSRFPYADIYSERESKPVPLPGHEPGSIIIRGNGTDQRFVINMLSQYYPGRPKYPSGTRDGYKAREMYFMAALEKISQLPDLVSLAFPARIGCAAAGGNWNVYYNLLSKFADKVNVPVTIYDIGF